PDARDARDHRRRRVHRLRGRQGCARARRGHPARGGDPALAARSVILCEVGPRDGLQNEPGEYPPAVRADLINRLAAARLPRIEAVSFVRDDRVPAMAGAEEVVERIERRPGVEYAGLALNERGWERFGASGLDRVNVTFGATERFNRANGNRGLAEAVANA